jgi:8-oxo-dGTP diphosphatase
MDPGTGKPLVRAAGVLLLRGGRVLLQHRDDRPDIVYPGAWAIFGGHLEPGEEPECGARREIEEELDLRLTGPLRLVYHATHAGRERYFYAAELPCDPGELTLREGQGMALLSAEEVARLPVVPLHRELILAVLTGSGAAPAGNQPSA